MRVTVQERSAIKELMKKLSQMKGQMEAEAEVSGKKIEVMDAAIADINKVLFPGAGISGVYKVEAGAMEKDTFIVQFEKWYCFVEEVMGVLDVSTNCVEADFACLMYYLEAASVQEIEDVLKENLKTVHKENMELYQKLLLVYKAYSGFWGELNPEEGVYDCIHQRAQALKEHINEWKWLFKELYDNRSKMILYNILMNWITFDVQWLKTSTETVFADYFDLDLIPETSVDEVFVDLGGYIGDTVEDFVASYSDRYKRIYTYEVNPQNYQELMENIAQYRNVIARNKAIGAERGTMYLNLEIGGSSTTIAKTGELEVDVVTLDEDIEERISWIKMDIEGSEQSALQGCRRHIENEKPKLTICTYHNNEDIWKIPQMVKEYNEDYKLYLRYNGNKDWPSEYVLFAL